MVARLCLWSSVATDAAMGGGVVVGECQAWCSLAGDIVVLMGLVSTGDVGLELLNG
jgi:hypothetical protein